MDQLFQSIRIDINQGIYVKDPLSSDLGKRIVQHSIEMIHDMGFEQFTFKKLGMAIGSTESSIYRYFENKHKLLIYLTSWYWGWVEYKLVFATHSISDPWIKLKEAIKIVTDNVKEDSSFSHVNEVLLNAIVINENSKSFLTKEVDHENKEGYFIIYKRLAKRLSAIIADVNPDYLFPNCLASTVLEGSIHQYFLQDHFKSLTDCDDKSGPTHFMIDLLSRTLKA
jgi:AcrR family transcriptional regulator